MITLTTLILILGGSCALVLLIAGIYWTIYFLCWLVFQLITNIPKRLRHGK